MQATLTVSAMRSPCSLDTLDAALRGCPELCSCGKEQRLVFQRPGRTSWLVVDVEDLGHRCTPVGIGNKEPQDITGGAPVRDSLD